MKIVINTTYGGFHLSEIALARINMLIPDGNPEENGEAYDSYDFDDLRSHPVLVQVVEELGTWADTQYSELKVVEIPDDTDYYISYYDGVETIHEQHQRWH